MMLLRLRFGFILIVLVLIIGAPLHAQNTLRPVTVFLTFIPNIQFSPMYVAIEKGYFADAGLEVTIEHGDEPDGVNLIAAGERQFGLISGEQVLAARANGRPVVSVYDWFQDYPIGIVYADGTIAEPADMVGKRVGIPGPFGATYTGLNAFLNANGLTEADIQLESIGFNAPDVFCVGGVDASVVYVNNEPLQIAARAASGECGPVTSISVFNVADYADIVSNGIVTNEQTISEEPELVAAFVAAFDRGLRDVLDNPAEAYLESLNYVESLTANGAIGERLAAIAAERRDRITTMVYDPAADLVERGAYRMALIADLEAEFSADALIQFNVLLATIDLWDAERPGLSDAESWTQTQETLLAMGVLDAPLDLEAAFTNDFLP